MTNHITQYRPTFFEGFESAEVDFATLEELLAIPFVKNFAETEIGRSFHRFSQSSYFDETLLMAEYNDGHEWWVVGRMRRPVEGLATWDGRKQVKGA